MKKKTILASLLISAVLALGATGCQRGGGGSKSSSSEQSSSASESSSESSSSEQSSSSEMSSSEQSSQSESSSSSEEEDNKVKLEQVDPFTLSANYRNARIKGQGYAGEQYTQVYNEDFKSTYVIQDVKALVVPVDFPDYPSSLYGNTEEDSRRLLDKVMFGGPDDMEWYSLSQYYKESSFGTCNISGVVAPWYHYAQNAKSLDKSKTSISKQIAVDLQDYYRKAENPIVDLDGNEYNLADFDANQDGFVDSIIMLYTAPITTTGELWWAFCWSVSGAFGKYTKDGHLEGANRFFWASFNFLFEKGNNQYYTSEEIKNGTAKPDAHTMTHEYGHVLSLPDYYITDYNSDDYSGLGGLDMMDYNIGDHNAYSKMLYGWVNPRRVTGTEGSVTTTLNSTTTTGDTIIIPAQGEWNNTYLDQYLMIEFLTPEGVAKKDGQGQYLGTYPLYYNKPGIRITHVDSRLGVWNRASSEYVFGGYTWTTTPPDNTSYISVAADNTASRSCFPNYKIIELLPSNGKSMKVYGKNADNNALYYQGASFGTNGIWENFKMNGISGKKDKEFGYTITVDKIEGNSSATITISHI